LSIPARKEVQLHNFLGGEDKNVRNRKKYVVECYLMQNMLRKLLHY